jgi:hypothetical protein
MLLFLVDAAVDLMAVMERGSGLSKSEMLSIMNRSVREERLVHRQDENLLRDSVGWRSSEVEVRKSSLGRSKWAGHSLSAFCACRGYFGI